MSCSPLCPNAVCELQIMGHHSRETPELSVSVAAAFQAGKERMWYTVAVHGLAQSWKKKPGIESVRVGFSGERLVCFFFFKKEMKHLNCCKYCVQMLYCIRASR